MGDFNVMKHIPCTLLILLMMVSISACGLTDPLIRDTRNWLVAITKNDLIVIDELTCSSQKKQFPIDSIFTTALTTLDKEMVSEEIKIDVSGLTIKTIQQNGDAAMVRVAGKIRTDVGSAAQAHDVDETWQMVKEEGNWKYCGNIRQVESIATQPPEDLDTLFTEADLSRMVIMRSEIPPERLEAAEKNWPAPVFNVEHGDSNQYILSHWISYPEKYKSQLESQYRNDGFQFYYYSEFDDKGGCNPSLSLCTVRSEAILWKDSADASWGIWLTHGNIALWKKLDNMADECYLLDNNVVIEYLCRIKNVSIDVQFMSPKGAIDGLFNKVYARVNSR